MLPDNGRLYFICVIVTYHHVCDFTNKEKVLLVLHNIITTCKVGEDFKVLPLLTYANVIYTLQGNL